MKASEIKQLVYTVRDKCRVCYTCVRECPAKAIKSVGGQSEIIDERCIGCGNCTKVCNQGAKLYISSIDDVKTLLKSDKKVIAAIAPSFPAEFIRLDYRKLVGMVKTLGFYKVTEVAFGADIVASKYKSLFEKIDARCIPYLSANCPAIVHYIKQFYPHLVGLIAPIASPVVAMSRILRKKYGEDCKIVFIGPCVAKKTESDEVDETLTFKELREMFAQQFIRPDLVEMQEFDPPIGGRGAIFPISRGMIQSVDMEDNVFDGNIVVAEGRADFQDALKEFDAGLLKSQHLELLCCDGCIMGPGMSDGGKLYARRNEVSNYVRAKVKNLDVVEWQKNIEKYSELDFSQVFIPKDRRFELPNDEEVKKALVAMGKEKSIDQLDCGACGYDTCREHAIAVTRGLADFEMCLPFSISKLHKSIKDLAHTNDKLAKVKEALKQSEKLASMGQLSAGIAHELNNPLGVVIMYANILLDECAPDAPIRNDLKLITEQAERCKKIVGGLLNFARKNQVNFVEIDGRKLIEQSLNSLIIPENIKINIEQQTNDLVARLDNEQMIQVLSNLMRNAFEAMTDGGELTATIDGNDNDIIFKVADNGTGIKDEDMNKIFEPFFTTKGIGKGTGLGLATAYGVIKMHKGQINVISNADPVEGATGTTFIISIPRNR